jgi:hypothetical protein
LLSINKITQPEMNMKIVKIPNSNLELGAFLIFQEYQEQVKNEVLEIKMGNRVWRDSIILNRSLVVFSNQLVPSPLPFPFGFEDFFPQLHQSHNLTLPDRPQFFPR